MGKSAGKTKTTSTTGMPGFQQPSIDKQLGEANRLYDQPGPQLFGGNWTAGFTDPELQGQQSMLGAANTLGNYGQNSMLPFFQNLMGQGAGQQFLPEMTGAAGNVADLIKNPYGPGYNQQALAQGTGQGADLYGGKALDYALNLPQNIHQDPAVLNAINAAVQPGFRNLTEQVLPGLRTEAIASGQYGGSPQSLSQALATERTTRGAQEVGAQMMGNMYSQALGQSLQAQQQGQAYNTSEANRRLQASLATAGLEQAGNLADINRRLGGYESLMGMYGGLYGRGQENALQAAGQSQNLMGMLTAPGQIQGGVGGQMRGMNQAGIDQARETYEYGQNLPYQKLQEYANMIRGPFGGVSESTVEGTPPNEKMQAVALALSGLGLAPQVIQQIKDIFGLGK